MAKIKLDEACPCGSGKLYRECHIASLRQQVTPDITQHLSLSVIPEPDPGSRAVFIYEGAGTIVMRGFDVGLSMDCGKCGAPLIVGMPIHRIQNVVIRCQGCGAFNDTLSHRAA